MITCDAWVLYAGADGESSVPGELRMERISFPDIEGDEVLVEPIYGCWEGNMTHALRREPVDIARQRGEARIIIGNCGIVRVLACRPGLSLREGDVCGVVSIGASDQFGYMVKAWGYDKIGSMGLLSKRCKIPACQLVVLPPSRFPLRQWASFWVRYPTAWSNWAVAYGAWRLQMSEEEAPVTHAWGWGGGVSLAELVLAKHAGCQTVMLCTGSERAETIARHGITPLDRTQFGALDLDPQQFEQSADYRRRYIRAEATFLRKVRELTAGAGVSIFIDNIGLPIYRATLRALGRQGVITTSGWKHGASLTMNRAVECIDRHTHVHTHAARKSEVVEAIAFAEQHGWIAPLSPVCYRWDEIPAMAQAYDQGLIADYFPVFEVVGENSGAYSVPAMTQDRLGAASASIDA